MSTESGKEETKKTTIDLPLSLLQQIKYKIAEDPRLSQGNIIKEALKKYFSLRTSLGWKESEEAAIHDIVFRAQISDDPEDCLEFPLSIDAIILLHKSCHEALNKAGVSDIR